MRPELKKLPSHVFSPSSRIIQKSAAFIFGLCLAASPLQADAGESAPSPKEASAAYIFVHGLSGWGSYVKVVCPKPLHML